MALPAFAQALEDETLEPVRLEHFYDLSNPPPEAKELTTAQRKTLFSQAFFEEQVTLEDLKPYRIRVAYRIVRELLRLHGIQENDTLGTLAPTLEVVDPWTELRTRAPRRLNTGPAHAVIAILDVADKLEPAGLPLLPPSVPQNALTPYVAADDVRLNLYVNAVRTIATYLGIEEGSKNDPRAGKWGLLGITNTLTIRLTFPTRLQLVQYERLLVKETLDLLAKNGRQETEQVLNEKYGFSDDEIILLFRLAMQRGRVLTRSDADEDKAIMILMLEDLVKRSRNAGSFRYELQALKTLSIVQALSKIEPEGVNAEFEKLVDSFEEEPRPPLQLPE